jgi:hypothetical protein
MRFPKGPFLVGLLAVGALGLAGCDSHSAAAPPGTTSAQPGTTSAAQPGTTSAAAQPTAPAGSSSTAASSARPSASAGRTGAMAPPPSPASPHKRAGARAIAERFYGLYLGRQFAASWDLLAPAAKRQIPLSTWVGVHEGCLPARGAGPGVIKSVTVFGNAAIVTAAITGASPNQDTVRAVFNYAGGRWGYSPGDLSIYRHGSVSADIGAARAAGFCSGRNDSVL